MQQAFIFVEKKLHIKLLKMKIIVKLETTIILLTNIEVQHIVFVI